MSLYQVAIQAMQDLQLEECETALRAAHEESALQETAERESKLVAALTEAQTSLSNLRRLHEASQKQLFNLQTRDEEERASSAISCHCTLSHSEELHKS